MNFGYDLVKDIDEWMYSELHGKRFPTGWAPIDGLLDGGIVAGEYGLIMAPPGMGKTTCLINIGYALAGLIGAANVLHISLEIPKEQVLARYAARIADVRLKRNDDIVNEADFKARLRSTAGKRLRGKLRVIDGEWSVESIRVLIDNLEGEGFHTEALIVDYADLLIPGKSRHEKRLELSDISHSLRVLGADCDIPVWSATQASRDALYKEVVTIASIAEDIGKAAIADIVIALCQTKDEEGLNQARLFMAKVRRAKSHSTIPVKINFETQAIIANFNAKTTND